MKRKIISAALALLMLLTAVGCGATTTSSSSEAPPVYVPDAAPTQTVHEFAYDEEMGVHEFTVESSGFYLLEVWGAQGGDCTGTSKEVTYTRYGGKGGYSKGYVWLDKGTTVYVCIGGEGGDYDAEEESAAGGYNGGGSATKLGLKLNHIFGGGGGATHIALQYGNLENLKNYASQVLIVAGGGGGARWQSNMSHPQAKFGNGGAGGGENGGIGQLRDSSVDETHAEYAEFRTKVGTQTTGFAFGKGEDSKSGQAGGGGGWYGGYSGSGASIGSGYGGSGYIGNVELGEMESGLQEGNGKAVITWAGNTEDTIPEGLTIPTPQA